MKIVKLFWNAAVSRHTMSKNEFTSGDKDTIRRSKEPTVVNDLDVLVAMVLLEDSPAVLSLGLLCADVGYFYERNQDKGESPSLTTDGRNHKVRV